jgi:hypothetical protein
MAFSFLRRPQTTQERRANQEWRDYDWKFCRPARRDKRLPNAWDDIVTHSDRCWKSHRKTQYKIVTWRPSDRERLV